MKYLIFALCVCAASAATVPPNDGSYTPWQAKASVEATVVPVVEPVEPVPVVKTILPVQVFKPVPPVVKSVPAHNEEYAQIVRFESDVKPDGYEYNYETENGINGQASATLKRLGENDVLVSQGSYKYISPEGFPIEVVYTADENGYHPQSESLPVGPETPEHVLRTLAYIEAHPPAKEIIKKL